MVDDFERDAPETGEWECMECGYIQAGSEARRPMECPECGAPASALEFFGDADDGDEERDDEDDLDEDEEF
jgi:hypothetical protein